MYMSIKGIEWLTFLMPSAFVIACLMYLFPYTSHQNIFGVLNDWWHCNAFKMKKATHWKETKVLTYFMVFLWPLLLDLSGDVLWNFKRVTKDRKTHENVILCKENHKMMQSFLRYNIFYGFQWLFQSSITVETFHSES